MNPTLAAIAVMNMVFDMGWKLFTEVTKNMTPAELDAFISNKEQSVANTKARIEAKFGTP